MILDIDRPTIRSADEEEVAWAACQVAQSVDDAISGTSWKRIDTFAECKVRTVHKEGSDAGPERISGRDVGVHTRLIAENGFTISVIATGPLTSAVAVSLDLLKGSSIVPDRKTFRGGTEHLQLDNPSDARGWEAVPRSALADLSARLSSAEDLSSHDFVFSRLSRVTACAVGENIVTDRQVRRRLYLELHTLNGGMGEDGVVLSHSDGVEQPAITGPLLERALRRANDNQNRIPSPDGRFPFVFNSASTGVIMHELVGHLLEADIISSGGTYLSNRFGSSVCGVPIDIVDDPTLIGRWGSFNYDDEGRPSIVTPLLREGIVCGVLTDRTHGPVGGSTYWGHNGRRASHEHPPLPRMSNLFMRRGHNSVEDVIGDLKSGVYCDSLTRGQVDPFTGRFILNMTSGNIIRSGKVAENLGPAILTGSILELLAGIRNVCDDMDDIQAVCGKAGQQVLVEMNAPSILVANVEIAGA